jgi:enamine deaminase RidA (YjgF/YER057c/UK114 family)
MSLLTAFTRRAAVFVCASLLPLAGIAQAVSFHKPPGASKPSYSEATEVVGQGVSTLYVSSLVPEPLDASAPKDSRAYFGDTQAQADGLLKRAKILLERHGYTMRDVVKVNVFLIADPTRGGTVDVDGFAKGYGNHFGTPETPTLPARTRLTVSALTNPNWLVAMDFIAARSRP